MKRALMIVMVLGVLLLGGYQIIAAVEPPPPCNMTCLPHERCNNSIACVCNGWLSTSCNVCYCPNAPP
jgi:hypothetical protein